MKDSTLRLIDRVILGIVSLVLFFSGLYLAGPWYQPVIGGSKQPIYKLLSDGIGVEVFGSVQLLVGLALLLSVIFVNKVQRGVLSSIVFAAFAIRLFSTIGVVIALDGKYLPPSYMSQVSGVATLGAYWLYLKKREPK